MAFIKLVSTKLWKILNFLYAVAGLFYQQPLQLITVKYLTVVNQHVMFFVGSFTIGNAETILEMVDWFFNINSDFVCFVPFLRTSFYTRIGSEIFFRVNIDHSAAWRSCTWIITVTDTTTWLVLSVVFPFHFGTYEFHGRQFAS